jgi:hypothetical protein
MMGNGGAKTIVRYGTGTSPEAITRRRRREAAFSSQAPHTDIILDLSRPYEPVYEKQKPAETIRAMLEECREFIDRRRLDRASDVAKAAILIAEEHGFEKLKEKATLMFIVLNIQMGRDEKIWDAIDRKWIEQNEVEKIISYFDEFEQNKSGTGSALVRTSASAGSTTALIGEVKGLVERLVGR